MLGKTHVVGSLAVAHVGLVAYTAMMNRKDEVEYMLYKEPVQVFGFELGEPLSLTAYALILATVTAFVLLLLRVGKAKIRFGYLGVIGFCLLALTLIFDSSYPFELALILLLFTLGTLLPDIDSETSTIGRYVAPIARAIPHRTITHTIWVVALILGFGIYLKSPYILALGVGYTIHILEDSFSKQGIAWFYPILGTYDTYSGGGTTKRNQSAFMKAIAYRTGGTAETIFYYGSIMIHIACVGFVTWHILA